MSTFEQQLNIRRLWRNGIIKLLKQQPTVIKLCDKNLLFMSCRHFIMYISSYCCLWDVAISLFISAHIFVHEMSPFYYSYQLILLFMRCCHFIIYISSYCCSWDVAILLFISAHNVVHDMLPFHYLYQLIMLFMTCWYFIIYISS